MGLALAKVPEEKLLEDPGLATRPAHQVKNRLNVVFNKYQEAHKELKEAMATGVQGEAFRKYQEFTLTHSNWVHDQGIMLDQIIKIQQEWKQSREGQKCGHRTKFQRSTNPDQIGQATADKV